MHGASHARLAAEVRLGGAVGAERVGVLEDRAPGGVRARVVELPRQRGDRPAARLALHRPHDEGRVLQVAGPVGQRGLVEQEDAEVGGDRVEAAGVDDPRPGALRVGVVALDRVAHEQDLAGQVDVVRPGVRAGGDEREPVAPVGADGRGHHATGGGQLRERTLVRGVGHEERPVGGRRAERRAHLLEPGPRAAREPDRDAGRRVLGQVRGGQPAHEAAGPVHDDVDRALGAHRRDATGAAAAAGGPTTASGPWTTRPCARAWPPGSPRAPGRSRRRRASGATARAPPPPRRRSAWPGRRPAP